MISPNNLSLLGVFAHPDDEGSCSGCLAKYAAEDGARAYVICATRGDGVDAKISDPSLASRETLAQVRSQELECACKTLGIELPIFLDYQDGEVDQVPLEEAARRLARLIRELQPLVLITHDPGGGYGHPDHIAVSAFTTRAFDLASDPSVDLGVPFAPGKLYYTAMPRSFLEKVPAFRERRADIRGQQLGFVGVDDEQITTQVEIRDWLRLKLDALSCHRTQFEFDPVTKQPKTFTASIPEEQRLQMFGHERFVLAKASMAKASMAKASMAKASMAKANIARAGAPPDGKEEDLFAGLR
ncbi:MAG: PIG-L deacetylase family protein [Anaerolineales bacterium]